MRGVLHELVEGKELGDRTRAGPWPAAGPRPPRLLRLAANVGGLDDARHDERGFRAGRPVPFNLYCMPDVFGEDVVVRTRGLQADDLQHQTVEKYVLPELLVDAAGQRLLRRGDGLTSRGALTRVADGKCRQAEQCH